MPWADEATADTTTDTTPITALSSSTGEEPPAPTPPPAIAVSKGKWADDDHADMPGVGSALMQGVRSGLGEAGETIKTLSGEKPVTAPSTSPAAAPLEWSDVKAPIASLAPKVAYQLGRSSPTLAAGIAGGAAGSLVEPGVGTLVGGAGGAALGAAVQSLGPSFSEELKKSPQDPDGAYNRALARAMASGAFSALGWSLFPARFFQGPVKNMLFQTLGVQPGVSVGEQATQNLLQGKSPMSNLGEAYATGVVGTAVPMAGHAVLGSIVRAAKPGEAKPGAELAPEAMAHPERPSPEPMPSVSENIAPPTSPEKVSSIDKPALAKVYDEISSAYPISEEGTEPSRWSKIPFANQADKMILGWKKTFQPELVSELSKQSEGYFREYNSASAQRRDSILNSQDEMHNVFERLSPEQQMEFMKGAAKEEGFKVSPELQPYYEEFRKLLDMTHKADKDIGSKLGYIQDYFPRQFKNPDQAAAFINNRVQQMGSYGFQKARTNDLLQDGLDHGLELVTTNPADLVTNRLMASAEVQEKTKLLQRLNGIGTAAPVRDPRQGDAFIRSGWQLVKDPVGNQWALHPDLIPMWKNVIADKGLWGNEGGIGSAFRGWMALKNAYVPIKLALSAFHPLHVAHINFVNGMTRGWTQLTRGGDIAGAANSVAKGIYGQFYFPEARAAKEAWLTPEWKQTPEQKGTVKVMNEGGFSPQLSEQLRMKGQRAFNDAVSNQQWLKTLPLGALNGFRKIQGVIFEHWIPALKTAAYLDEAKSLFERRPDLLDDETQRRVALGAIAKSVDNRYGEMFYRNLFWNKTLKDAGIGSFLSLGWNLGFAREFGGGMIEPLMRKALSETPSRKTVKEAQSKAAFAVLYMGTAMALNATMTKMMSGENPEGMDYFLPRVGGNNPDGSPRRVSNMFYTREIPMLVKHIQEQQSIPGGLAEMLWNKMMLEPIKELWTNRDYYGYNIMDESSPFYQRYYQLGKYILSDQFNPITISGAKRALQASGKWNPDDSVLQKMKKIVTEPEGQMSLLGFGPAPAYAAKTATLNRLNYLFSRYVSPAERPQAEREIMEQRRDARMAFATAQQKGDQPGMTEAAKRLGQLGVTTAMVRKVRPGTQDLYMFQRLPFTIQKNFLGDLSADDFKRYYPKANKNAKADPEIQRLVRKYYRQQ